MDYALFLSLVNDELHYLEAFSLEGEYELMKAAGALVALKEYIHSAVLIKLGAAEKEKAQE